MNDLQCQDTSTPEARESHYRHCWEMASDAGNKAREMLAKVITHGLSLPLDRDIRNLIGPYMFPTKSDPLEEAAQGTAVPLPYIDWKEVALVNQRHYNNAMEEVRDLREQVRINRRQDDGGKQLIADLYGDCSIMADALTRVRGGLCYPDEYWQVANEALEKTIKPPVI